MSDQSTDLTFTDGASAFEYSCQCLDCTVELKKPLPALVLDAREHFGQTTPTKINEDKTQTVVLRIPTPDGGFVVLARTAGADGPMLKGGELVAWMPLLYNEQLANETEEAGLGWVGVIIGTLKPVLREGGWLGDVRYGE
ncbi:hypothetical protein [Breoghania sp.]|uniref:hypothetical protein n=1 Tax=Breoghania sp. TaxID=2065378 RepID=UPI0029CAA10E|nr:hypothetical protein [Breoghania sp.]